VKTDAVPQDRTVAHQHRRQWLAAQLARARARTDALFALLTPTGLFERPVAERHRFIFYVGHLEAFDFNLLCRDALGARSLDAEFERLFAFGIDPIDGGLPTDTASDWPSELQVRAWATRARREVDNVIAAAPFTGWLADGWAIQLAIEHRLMHAETLCYLLQRLNAEFKKPGPLAAVQSPVPPRPGEVTVPDGVAVLGLARSEAPFLGWDNEYEKHRVDVSSFTISRLPVSNGQWLQFVEAGGYATRAFWNDSAWRWIQSEGLSHPVFWRRQSRRWLWRGMFGDIPLPLEWPVYVSHAEASAYAQYLGARLPTEAEWHRAAALESDNRQAWPRGNHGGLRFDPVASGQYTSSDSIYGVADLTGNGWEWTSTRFAAFVGFEPLPFYQGYSANFFDDQHFVLKGASPVTDVAFLRPSFRNWFQPHYPHVFAKFRLVNVKEGALHG
jgi:gamma-glutamyl hercynylcysteine S-oxide synthase